MSNKYKQDRFSFGRVPFPRSHRAAASDCLCLIVEHNNLNISRKTCRNASTFFLICAVWCFVNCFLSLHFAATRHILVLLHRGPHSDLLFDEIMKNLTHIHSLKQLKAKRNEKNNTKTEKLNRKAHRMLAACLQIR